MSHAEPGQGAMMKETSLNRVRASAFRLPAQHKCKDNGEEGNPKSDHHWTSRDP